jgi:hypothetical protein
MSLFGNFANFGIFEPLSIGNDLGEKMKAQELIAGMPANKSGMYYEADVLRCLEIAIATERESCAEKLELSRSELLLLAGEMTAQELRTVLAVLTNRAAVIRRRAI